MALEEDLNKIRKLGYEKPYRTLYDRLKEGSGNQILVVEQKLRVHGCPGFIPPPKISSESLVVDSTLRLGVLTGGIELKIAKEEIILPTKTYAIKTESSWELQEGSITLPLFYLLYLDQEVTSRDTSMLNDESDHFQHGLLIYVGSEVEQYFSQGGFLNFTYVEALKLLGQELPQNFQEEYDQRMYDKKVGILLSLAELTFTEENLTLNTKSLQDLKDLKQAIGFEHFFLEDYTVTDSKEKQTKIKKQIVEDLKKAVELGMHQQAFTWEPQAGITFNVPEYISSMCEKYEIES